MEEMTKQIMRDRKLNSRIQKKHDQLIEDINKVSDSAEFDFDGSEAERTVDDTIGLDELENIERKVDNWSEMEANALDKKGKLVLDAYEEGKRKIAKEEGISIKELEKRINE